MALTRYSTAAQVKANNDKIQLELTVDAQIEDRIHQIDKFIRGKLAKFVDFTVIDAMATVPDWLNSLSQYGSMYLCLVRIYGAKRDADQVSDVKWWQDLFNELLQECLNGEIDFGTAGIGADFQWDSRRRVAPMFGPAYNPTEDSSDYGEYKELEDLQDDREYDNTGT
jgi:hypothetical protein